MNSEREDLFVANMTPRERRIFFSGVWGGVLIGVLLMLLATAIGRIFENRDVEKKVSLAGPKTKPKADIDIQILREWRRQRYEFYLTAATNGIAVIDGKTNTWTLLSYSKDLGDGVCRRIYP